MRIKFYTCIKIRALEPSLDKMQLRVLAVGYQHFSNERHRRVDIQIFDVATILLIKFQFLFFLHPERKCFLL